MNIDPNARVLKNANARHGRVLFDLKQTNYFVGVVIAFKGNPSKIYLFCRCLFLRSTIIIIIINIIIIIIIIIIYYNYHPSSVTFRDKNILLKRALCNRKVIHVSNRVCLTNIMYNGRPSRQMQEESVFTDTAQVMTEADIRL